MNFMLKQLKNKDDRDTGFSLIELIVVVIILGILAAIAIPAYNGIENRARASAVETAAATTLKEAVAADLMGADDVRFTEILENNSSDDITVIYHDNNGDRSNVPGKPIVVEGYWANDSSIDPIVSTPGNEKFNVVLPKQNASNNDGDSGSTEGEYEYAAYTQATLQCDNELNGFRPFLTNHRDGNVTFINIDDDVETVLGDNEGMDLMPGVEYEMRITGLFDNFSVYGGFLTDDQYDEYDLIILDILSQNGIVITMNEVYELFDLFQNGESTAEEEDLLNQIMSIVENVPPPFWEGPSGSDCIISVDSWHNSGVTSLEAAFDSASKLESVVEPPHTVTNMDRAFYFTNGYNENISEWNVDNVTTWDVFNAYSDLIDSNIPPKFRGQSGGNDNGGNDSGGNDSGGNGTTPPEEEDPGSLGGTTIVTLKSDTDRTFYVPYVEDFNGSFWISTDGGTNRTPVNASTPLDAGVEYKFGIEGVFSRISFSGLYGVSDTSSIRKVNEWNSNLNDTLTNMQSSFRGAINLVSIETPPLNSVTDMSNMFHGSSFNQDISDWNVSSVTNMSSMFENAFEFNNGGQPLDLGNKTSNVTNMYRMFAGSDSFNQPINWNTSNVETMQGMFYSNSAFNQDISDWDVSNVENMSQMFDKASNFNNGGEPLDWSNTGKVKNMSNMFFMSSSFNQPIGNWDTSNVEDMSVMFQRATTFNQDISGWDVGNVESMTGMFSGAAKFNMPLNSWDVSKVKYMNGMFNGTFEDVIFNQPLNKWDVSNVESMHSMFRSAKYFNQDLSGWEVNNMDYPPFWASLKMESRYFPAFNFN